EVVGHGLATADPGRAVGRRHVGLLGGVVAAARMTCPSGFVNSYFYKTGFKRPESARAAAPLFALERRRPLLGEGAHALQIVVGVAQLLLQVAFQVQLLRQGIAAGGL